MALLLDVPEAEHPICPQRTVGSIDRLEAPLATAQHYFSDISLNFLFINMFESSTHLINMSINSKNIDKSA